MGRPLGGEGAARGVIRASDGVDLRYLRWQSGDTEPSVALVFLHGIASHSGWFSETASELAAQSVVVYGPDRRGSGRSGGRRGHLDLYERAIDDLDGVMRVVEAEQKGSPVYLAGSSWAAKLALVYAASRLQRLSGLMLLGPGLIPRVNLPPLRRVEVAIGHVFAPTAQIRIPLGEREPADRAPATCLIRSRVEGRKTWSSALSPPSTQGITQASRREAAPAPYGGARSDACSAAHIRSSIALPVETIQKLDVDHERWLGCRCGSVQHLAPGNVDIGRLQAWWNLHDHAGSAVRDRDAHRQEPRNRRHAGTYDIRHPSD
jgi:alpha-beta hydrolase superfamily lysophospholipase